MILIALLLVVEGLSTGLWLAKVVPSLSGFGSAAIVLVVLRGLIGATQLTGGVFLIGGRRSAVRLSQMALIASAVVTTLEIGEQLTPNNLLPSLRWPLVLAYWIYALGAAAYLGREQTRVVRNPRDLAMEKYLATRPARRPVVVEPPREEERNEQDGHLQDGSGQEQNKQADDATRPDTGDPSETGERPRLFD